MFTLGIGLTFRSWNSYGLHKRSIQPVAVSSPAMRLTLCSSSLQALCAVGICGGHDLRDQVCQEEGESSAHEGVSCTVASV